MASSVTKLASPKKQAVSTAEINAALRDASYLTLYSRPDPGKEDKLEFKDMRAVAVHVNEQLHRFPVNLAAGSTVGEALANIHLEWRPAPENFVWVPGVAPPATPLDPGRSQPFVIVNGKFSCRDQAESYFRGAGGGRTYPTEVDGGQQLHLAGIVNVVESGGALEGLEGTIITNGYIKPPEGLSLLVVARFVDPEGALRSEDLRDAEHGINPDPDYASLVLLAEPDPESPGTTGTDADGSMFWESNEVLRLVNLDCSLGVAIQCIGVVADGPVVGRHTARFTFYPGHNGTPRITSEAGVFSFIDRKGNHAGELRANLDNSQIFPSRQTVGGCTVHRLGGSGPLRAAESTGMFAGAKGMLAVNGAFTTAPLGGSALYVFRIHDARGAIRAQMRDAWALKPTWRDTKLEPGDGEVLNLAVESLAEGLELKAWWERQHAGGGRFQERFELVRTAHRGDTAYGFFDEAPLRMGKLNVMGCYQEMLFDRPRAEMPDRRKNLREYVLNYFLRTMSFREPASAGGNEFGIIPKALRSLSLDVDTTLRGLGFTQQYYRLLTGEIGRFATEDQRVIVDQRRLGDPFEWIVMKANLHDFKLVLRPFGNHGPQMAFPMQQETWLVTGPGFVVDREDEFGLGYAVLRHHAKGRFLAYGPSEFDHGFGSTIFRIEPDGAIRVRMAFAVNRPSKVMNIPYDPIEMFFRTAKTLTLGATNRVTEVVDAFMPSFIGSRGFDPVQAYIAMANGMTGGAAGKHFGFSVAQLERSFLVQHYIDHHRIIRGALMTFQNVTDWAAGAALPRSIRTGVPELE